MEKHSLPIKFEQVMNVLDDRFMKVKIWIAHTGENRNRCIFTKEVLESMIPSLSNVPILGYVAVDDEGNADFEGHEERLVVEDNQFKLKYVGRAYGMIPETNNARFESRYGSDGLEREYLVVDGIVWRKFPEVEEIFDENGGFKSQSMELQPSSIKGYMNEDGLFNFEEARFEGACILGNHVSPAMISSTIEKYSFSDKFQSELSEMLDEFNKHFSATNEKGDDTVPTNEETIVTEQTEFTEETPVVETPVVEETPADNFEESTPAVEITPVVEENPVEPADFAKKDEEEEEDEEKDSKDSEKEDEEEDKKKFSVEEKFTVKFELSHDDIRSGLYQSLESHETFKDSWVYVSQVFDNHAIVQDESQGKFFKINYVKHENAVSLGEHEELFPMFLTSTEKSAVDSTRNNFATLEEEVVGLREFKSNVELAEKESKLAQYSTILSEEEYGSIKENLGKFSMVEIEKEIGFLLLKKNNFSSKEQEFETPAKVTSTNAVESNPYGSASIYFSK